MGKYSGILLCSDFDGTFAQGGKVVPENTAAVRRFIAEGGRFTIASGRGPYEFDRYGDEIPVNAPLISLNGTAIFDRTAEKLLYAGLLNDSAKDLAKELWAEFDCILGICFFALDGYVHYKRTTETPLDEFVADLSKELYKCVLRVDGEESDDMLALLSARYGDRFNFSRSGRSGIEFQDVADTKATAARRLCSLLGDIRQLVCVGDYENDIPMLREADLSFAVGGGSPAAQAVADRITVPCAEGAVADVIAAL